MERAQTSETASDFLGIYLLTDPIDLPPGAAQDQLNLKSDQPGSASVRGGMLPVSFDQST